MSVEFGVEVAMVLEKCVVAFMIIDCDDGTVVGITSDLAGVPSIIASYLSEWEGPLPDRFLVSHMTTGVCPPMVMQQVKSMLAYMQQQGGGGSKPEWRKAKKMH